MKIFLFSFFIIVQIACLSDIEARSSYPASINLVNQEDIDEFVTTYPELDYIVGDLKIGDFRDACTQPDITNLSGLLQLTGIGGNLYIHKTLLNDLSGLDNLYTISGSLILSSNGYLNNLNGLNSIDILGGLRIEYDNYELYECDALLNLNKISGDVLIYNDGFSNLNGFSNITEITGDFILECDDLSDLQGLSKLSNIEGDFNLTNNHSLSNIDQLLNLTYIKGNLIINENQSLENLDGFINLNSIHGFILINYNSNLQDIIGIENIDPQSIKNFEPNFLNEFDIYLGNNPNLNSCGAASVCKALGLYGATYYIEGNASGCLESALSCSDLVCTTLTSPVNQSQNIPVDASLSWPVSINATGYKISAGTTPGGNEILNNIDVGNNTSYNPENNFPCGTQIYVRIMPYRTGQIATGCSEQSFFTEQVIAEAVGDQVICKGYNVFLNSSGGSYYSWFPQTGLNDPNIANPIANPTTTTNYTVTVRNERGCFDTANTQVIVNLPPVPNISSTSESGNNFNNGSAMANPTGGKSPYSYLWSNGKNTNTIQNLIPGVYKLTVTDANNCSITDSAIINKFICPQLTLSSVKNNVTCNNLCNGYIKINNISNAVAPLNYLWNTGAISDSISNLCAGVYKISATDSKNCIVSDSFIVTQPDAIIITIDSIQNFSQNNSGFIKISTNIGGRGRFIWTGPNGFTSTDEDIQNLLPGCYNLLLTDTLTSCTSDTTICISNTSSTEFTDEIKEIMLYPNPAQEFVNIDFKHINSIPQKLTILDQSGKIVRNEKIGLINHIQTLNTSGLNSGFYYVKILFENESKSYKLIIL